MLKNLFNKIILGKTKEREVFNSAYMKLAIEAQKKRENSNSKLKLTHREGMVVYIFENYLKYIVDGLPIFSLAFSTLKQNIEGANLKNVLDTIEKQIKNQI